MFDVTEKELKMTFAKNLRNLLDKRGMDRCDLLEYFPKEKKNGEVYHYTKEDIKRLKSKGNSIEKNNELGKIKRWTNGSSMPDYIELMKLCEVLECDTDYLLKDHAPISKDISAISEYMGLAPDTIEKICNYFPYQKELLDNMINADWLREKFGIDVWYETDGLSLMLNRIKSIISSTQRGEYVYHRLEHFGKDDYFPLVGYTASQLFKSRTLDEFSKIIDGLTEISLNDK